MKYHLERSIGDIYPEESSTHADLENGSFTLPSFQRASCKQPDVLGPAANLFMGHKHFYPVLLVFTYLLITK